MSDSTLSFVDAVLAGAATPGDIDDYIDRWHDGPSSEPLHEYLGLTWAEYSRWVDDPASLTKTLAARRKVPAAVLPA
jgi:hypothetical protein